MSKIKRSVLKQLIKECLVEILIEGIDSEPGTEALVEAARPRRINKSNPDSLYNRLNSLSEKLHSILSINLYLRFPISSDVAFTYFSIFIYSPILKGNPPYKKGGT